MILDKLKELTAVACASVLLALMPAAFNEMGRTRCGGGIFTMGNADNDCTLVAYAWYMKRAYKVDHRGIIVSDTLVQLPESTEEALEDFLPPEAVPKPKPFEDWTEVYHYLSRAQINRRLSYRLQVSPELIGKQIRELKPDQVFARIDFDFSSPYYSRPGQLKHVAITVDGRLVNSDGTIDNNPIKIE